MQAMHRRHHLYIPSFRSIFFPINLPYAFFRFSLLLRGKLAVLSLSVIRVQQIAVIRQHTVNLHLVLTVFAVLAQILLGLLLSGLKGISGLEKSGKFFWQMSRQLSRDILEPDLHLPPESLLPSPIFFTAEK